MYDFSDYGGHERRGEPTDEDRFWTFSARCLGALFVVGMGLMAAGTMLVWLIARAIE